jgi:hypothetical protein
MRAELWSPAIHAVGAAVTVLALDQQFEYLAVRRDGSCLVKFDDPVWCDPARSSRGDLIIDVSGTVADALAMERATFSRWRTPEEKAVDEEAVTALLERPGPARLGDGHVRVPFLISFLISGDLACGTEGGRRSPLASAKLNAVRANGGRSPRNAAELFHVVRAAERDAEKILKDNWPAVMTLTRSLLRRRKPRLTMDQVLQLIDRPPLAEIEGPPLRPWGSSGGGR